LGKRASLVNMKKEDVEVFKVFLICISKARLMLAQVTGGVMHK